MERNASHTGRRNLSGAAMAAGDFRKGKAALERLVAGLERLAADPAALARLDAATLADPTLAAGPDLLSYLFDADSLDADAFDAAADAAAADAERKGGR